MRKVLVNFISLLLLAEIAAGNETPECFCPGTDPPGGLAPANTPQIVLISFDDALNARAYDAARYVLDGFVNPNGTAIQATYFTIIDGTDFWLAEKWYKAGHEVAVHTMTHATSTDTETTAWRKEIAGCRTLLAGYADIPRSAITGFRAPHLMVNDEMYQVLREQNFAYDSSFLERVGEFSPSETNRVWPYTSNTGEPEACEGDPCSQHGPGLFQVPVWAHVDTNGAPDIAMDPPYSYDYEAVMELWKRNFENRYYGNRAPLTLAFHASWSGAWLGEPGESWRKEAVRDFIQWTQAFEDVWFVSYSALVAFMQDPQDIEYVHDFDPFITTTQQLPPEDEVITCWRGFRTTADCPDLPLKPDTVYADPDPLSAGFYSLERETYSTSIVVEVEISNDTDRVIHDWEWAFTLDGGEISHMWNAHYGTEQDRILVRPAEWLYPLNPGEAVEIGFTATGATGSAIEVQTDSLTLFAAQPQRPRITSLRVHDSGQAVVEWDETGFGYKLEKSTNEFHGPWKSGDAIYNTTTRTNTVTGNPSSVYYRIRRIE